MDTCYRSILRVSVFLPCLPSGFLLESCWHLLASCFALSWCLLDFSTYIKISPPIVLALIRHFDNLSQMSFLFYCNICWKFFIIILLEPAFSNMSSSYGKMMRTEKCCSNENGSVVTFFNEEKGKNRVNKWELERFSRVCWEYLLLLS